MFYSEADTFFKPVRLHLLTINVIKTVFFIAVTTCPIEKGLIKDENGNCVCPPRYGLNENDECMRCLEEKGLKIDERGRCVCALERGMIVDERGNCVCPTEHGYRMNHRGFCVQREYWNMFIR